MFPKLILLLGLTLICSATAQNVYPCDLGDYNCIQNVLAGNSDCDTLIWNSVPPKMSFNNVRYEIPSSNLTLYFQYFNIYNVDQCYVSAFFFNMSSNVAVLGLSCPNLQLEGHQTLQQHRPNAADQEYTIRFTTDMPLVYLTANLRHANNIDLCDTRAYPYLTALPCTSYSPDDAASAQFLENAEDTSYDTYFLYMREFFLTSATTIFYQYVSYMLCDFGCGVDEYEVPLELENPRNM